MFAFQRFVKLFEAADSPSDPSDRILLPMASPSLAFKVALSSLLSLSTCPVQAEWQLMQEPAVWQSRRGELLPGDGWIFMEALDTPALKAAEYIRAPKTVDGAVEVEAGLLIQRAGQDQWTQRVLPMRANCANDQLEQRQADGAWTVYPGRDGTVVKVRWICALR
ncbi:hypothetical protein [Parasynechococcus sp.]|uniref:hypothetical protein n=1 Tax=Parasynechococcus sp. TaxID=3101203 RepID=UPI003703865C